MKIHGISITEEEALELSQFKEMDYYAVENYFLPIELMMENAGLQLATLIGSSTKNIHDKILIGIGNGNNGGGGLVAARRLAAWGYEVHLDLHTEINKPLPKLQLERAIKFGVKLDPISQYDIWVDAYLGFSQRLPLSPKLTEIVASANKSECHRISLDLPTGFLGDTETTYFHAHKVLTLAAPKKLLYHLPKPTEIYIADIGIPRDVYKRFGMTPLPFQASTILRLINPSLD